jgi:hypothetical protein
MPTPPSFLRSLSGVFATIVAALLWAAPAQASSLPKPVLEADYSLRRVGAGELTWLGRPIYDASLWTAHGRFSGYRSGEPVALSLWYRRDFSRHAAAHHGHGLAPAGRSAGRPA